MDKLKICRFCGTNSTASEFYATHTNRCKQCHSNVRKVYSGDGRTGFTAKSKDRSLLAKRRRLAIDKGRKYARSVD